MKPTTTIFFDVLAARLLRILVTAGLILSLAALGAPVARAQGLGGAGTVQGTVKDPTGGVRIQSWIPASAEPVVATGQCFSATRSTSKWLRTQGQPTNRSWLRTGH